MRFESKYNLLVIACSESIYMIYSGTNQFRILEEESINVYCGFMKCKKAILAVMNPSYVANWELVIMCWFVLNPSTGWRVSSVGRTLHQYRKGKYWQK